MKAIWIHKRLKKKPHFAHLYTASSGLQGSRINIPISCHERSKTSKTMVIPTVTTEYDVNGALHFEHTKTSASTVCITFACHMCPKRPYLILSLLLFAVCKTIEKGLHLLLRISAVFSIVSLYIFSYCLPDMWYLRFPCTFYLLLLWPLYSCVLLEFSRSFDDECPMN